MWLFSDISNNFKVNEEFSLINFNGYQLYTNEEYQEIKTTEFHCIVIGAIWPRYKLQKNLNFDNWLSRLISSSKDDFILSVKGDFTIFVSFSDKISILNDHHGFSPIYFQIEKKILSNDFNFLDELDKTFDENSILESVLYNRVLGETTYNKYISNKGGSNKIEIINKNFIFTKYWKYEELVKIKSSKKIELDEITTFIEENINFFFRYFNWKECFITLTGGKDCRSALATLLKIGIQPKGLSYGNSLSKDVVYARKLANKLKLSSFNYCFNNNASDLNQIIAEIHNFSPMISYHRAHRYYAFKSTEKTKASNSVLFNGYLGGELLMGIYPDKLVFTDYVLKKLRNESKGFVEANNFLKKDFLKNKKNDFKEKEIKTPIDAIFKIGLLHHMQDIHLAKKEFNYIYSFFLDIDFLHVIFSSEYNFLCVKNESKNPFKRYNLYKLNCHIQYKLAPDLHDIPFAKKGNYTLKQYQKGRIYWSIVKTLNYFFSRRKYPPNFEYGRNYVEWVLNQLTVINNEKHSKIHDYFDINNTILHLKNTSKKNLSEKDLCSYTRILNFYNYLK